MKELENKCKYLLLSIENGDVEAFKRFRASIIAEIIDDSFEVDTFGDYLTIGKAVFVILDDMPNNGMMYNRVVLTALYSLLKLIINDKNDCSTDTAIASALLLVLFSENQDFFGGEYIVSKVKSVDMAIHQYMGICCVFYWKYSFAENKPLLFGRTQQRLQKALESPILQIPDVATRNKVIDFEYNNLNSMIHDLPVDLTLRYRGLMYVDYEKVLSSINSSLRQDLLYFTNTNSLKQDNQSFEQTIIPNVPKKEVVRQDSASNKELENKNNQKKNTLSNQSKSSSGCMGILIIFIVISLVVMLSI